MNGVGVRVVVEIGPDLAPAARLFHHPVGPAEQRLVGVAAPIFAARAVAADIGDRPRRPARRDQARQVVRAVAGVVSREQVEDGGVVPARLAEFEDGGDVGGKELEKSFQPFAVEAEARRQLEEERAERGGRARAVV